MYEYDFGSIIHLLGYPIALALMIAIYASEILSATVRTTTRWLVPAKAKVRRR